MCNDSVAGRVDATEQETEVLVCFGYFVSLARTVFAIKQGSATSLRCEDRGMEDK